MPPPLAVHCELAPVLVNRTAVYRLCRLLPGELARRGFRATSSALLSRLNEHAEPASALERRLYGLSRRWLYAALGRPGLFRRLLPAAAWLPGLRRPGGLRLYLDPLYLLFHRGHDNGVVLVYDVTPATDPGWHGRGAAELYLRAFDLLARSRCHVVAVSRNTADHLRVNWGVAPSRLTVLPLGLLPQSRSRSARGAYPAAAPFLLFVGSVEPRKNVAGLIRAYAASGLFASHGVRLRVVGEVPAAGHPVMELARATPGVGLAGFVSDTELSAAYRGCLAFVYPSFCEGFGLPLLEAMHHGCVCLATCTGASPEVAGDAALYVDPYSVEDIARGLRRVLALSDTARRAMAARGRQRAKQFTWDGFCDGLAGVLRRHAAECGLAPAEGSEHARLVVSPAAAARA
ncbi:MAG TPA: glycosyltransferase family 1 protein [Gemmataceae bacterium]|nr:glycosyltransferase family 1 protein [Gemmataceae bacterium]